MTSPAQSKKETSEAGAVSDAKATEPKRFESVWSPALAKLGFTQISDVFLHQFHQLPEKGKMKMSDAEFILLIHLMSHKRDNKMVFPGVESLAIRMKKSERQIMRLTASLAGRGLLVKHVRKGQSVRYDMRPLIKRVEELIPVEKKARAHRVREREERNLPPDLKTELPAKSASPPRKLVSKAAKKS